jgi:hypothetical protein
VSIATVPVDGPTYRLIPSRYPPISAFESVTSTEDLEAVMDLEGWSNDRLVIERVSRLSKSEWVYGVPNASVIMASFLHGGLSGLRFTGPDLNGWYASLAHRTAARGSALCPGRYWANAQFRNACKSRHFIRSEG